MVNNIRLFYNYKDIKNINLFILSFVVIIYLSIYVINIGFAILAIILLSKYGIVDDCTRMISIWMICDIIEKINRVLNKNGLFSCLLSISQLVWNIINICLIKDCTLIHSQYIDYAMACIIYDAILICIVSVAYMFFLIYVRKLYNKSVDEVYSPLLNRNI